MPAERPSTIGARMQRRLAGLPEEADTVTASGTPLQHILSGQSPPPDIDTPPARGSPPRGQTAGETAVHWINSAGDFEPPPPTPEPPPLPAPANDGEIEALDYARRTALHERQHCRDLITAIDHSIARNHAQLTAEREGVAEAEQVLREVRLHSRRNLAAAYINNEPTDVGMTESDAEQALAVRVGHRRHQQDIAEALASERASLEAELPEHDRAVSRAAGRLLSRSPAYLAEAQRLLYDGYAAIRQFRTRHADLSHLVDFDDDLTRLIDNMQPVDSGRRRFWHTDEDDLSRWTALAERLLSDPSATLPDPSAAKPAASSASPASPERDASGRFLSKTAKPPRQRSRRRAGLRRQAKRSAALLSRAASPVQPPAKLVLRPASKKGSEQSPSPE